MTSMSDMTGKWRDFKTDPPYDWRTETDGDMESDPEWGFIYYSYKYGPWGHGEPGAGRLNLISRHPYAFQDGAFTGYRSHMLTSTYPGDCIKVIAWLPLDDAVDLLRAAYWNQYGKTA